MPANFFTISFTIHEIVQELYQIIWFSGLQKDHFLRYLPYTFQCNLKTLFLEIQSAITLDLEHLVRKSKVFWISENSGSPIVLKYLRKIKFENFIILAKIAEKARMLTKFQTQSFLSFFLKYGPNNGSVASVLLKMTFSQR